MYGAKQFPQVGYPTPTTIPEETTCLILNVPSSAEWWGIVVGVLYSLILEWNWQQFEGGLDRDVVAARWQTMFEDALDIAAATAACPTTDVDTPYWDDATDVDDEFPADEQPWYGYVADATAPTELDFVEDATIWAFTGLIAVSTGGAGIPAALLFRTTATKFVLSYKNGGNIGDIIRFFVDGVKIYEGADTGDGSIADVLVIGDPANETHQIFATYEAA